jgi:hypothetical protein
MTIYTLLFIATVEILLWQFQTILTQTQLSAPHVAKIKGKTTPLDDLIFRFKRTRTLMPLSLIQVSVVYRLKFQPRVLVLKFL